MGEVRKVAVVTGAANGIGRAFATRLAAEGVSVAVLDLVEPTETVELIARAGGEAEGFVADVSSPEQVAAAVSRVEARFGPVSILVNNAGLHPDPPIPFESMSFEAWRRMLSIDLDSMFIVTQAVLPGMRSLGWGRIVNMSSSVVTTLVPHGASHYTAAKAGAVGLTRALASELAPLGITVNGIAPGLTLTPGTLNATGEHASTVFEAVAGTQPVPRTIRPEDVVGALAYLVSEEADFVTAQVLHVDGGISRVS